MIPRRPHPEQPETHPGPAVHPPGPCPACPVLARLERAKGVYRAQRDEITQLQERLARYERIGLRRFQQSLAYDLTGTQLWSENFLLHRAVQAQAVTIAQQRAANTALKQLVQLSTAPTSTEVQP